MDVLEALGGWSNINREKLDQIKVDNPPLYNAITKALNLLAKKYGGEDIVIQKPIEVVPEVVSQNEDEITDYKILKKIEVLSLSKGDWPTRMEILDGLLNEVGYDKDELTAISKFIQDLYKKIDDLNARDLILRVDDEYQVSGNGQALIDSYELQNKQVEQVGPSDEDLKLEMLLRMADYYDGGDYQLLTQNTIIFDAYKQQWEIPPNKYFGVVVKLLQDGLVEKDPSGDTDSIRLTNKGYQKAMDWFEENLPEEATSIEEPTQGLNYRRPSPLESATINPTGTTKIGNDGNEWRVTENKNGVKRWVKVGEPQYDLPQHRLEGILKQLSEVISKTHDYVTISELYRQLYDVIVPITYTQYGLSGEPTLEKDLQVMESMGLVKSQTTTFGREYYIDTKGSELLTQLKFVEAQKQKAQILAQAQITKTPEFSQEPPISEIEEDEVDLDILEQQLNDDSLEFDISDEDLENLEF